MGDIEDERRKAVKSRLVCMICTIAAVALAADEISEKLSVADVQATRGQ